MLINSNYLKQVVFQILSKSTHMGKGSANVWILKKKNK